jgi:hypothetical protein
LAIEFCFKSDENSIITSREKIFEGRSYTLYKFDSSFAELSLSQTNLNDHSSKNHRENQYEEIKENEVS